MVEGPSETRTLETVIFGRDVRWEYSDHAIGYSVLGLRVVMGWIFLQAGIEKLLDPGWTAAGFLQFAVPEGNPFPWLWAGMTGSPLVDALVVYGQLGIGLSLLLGVLLRFGALMGALQMLLFWMASLQGGLLAGLPLEHGWVIDDHLVYVVLLFGLGAFGAGRILGVDGWLEAQDVVRRNPWLEWVLG